jgi:hypothetical protein
MPAYLAISVTTPEFYLVLVGAVARATRTLFYLCSFAAAVHYL